MPKFRRQLAILPTFGLGCRRFTGQIRIKRMKRNYYMLQYAFEKPCQAPILVYNFANYFWKQKPNVKYRVKCLAKIVVKNKKISCLWEIGCFEKSSPRNKFQELSSKKFNAFSEKWEQDKKRPKKMQRHEQSQKQFIQQCWKSDINKGM